MDDQPKHKWNEEVIVQEGRDARANGVARSDAPYDGGALDLWLEGWDEQD